MGHPRRQNQPGWATRGLTIEVVSLILSPNVTTPSEASIINRTLIFLSLLLTWGGYIVAQGDDPIGSCNCVCKQGTSRCMPSFASQCPNVCAISACGSPDQVDLLKTTFILGGCPFIPSPGTYDTLVTHVIHAIGHQGARIWIGHDSNSVASGEDYASEIARSCQQQ